VLRTCSGAAVGGRERSSCVMDEDWADGWISFFGLEFGLIDCRPFEDDLMGLRG
jgi:hypothetical protein